MEPATVVELKLMADERRLQRAVDLRLEFGAEKRMTDPAFRKKMRPVYTLPHCPDCARTIRHYGRCPIRKTFSLKPSCEWVWADE